MSALSVMRAALSGAGRGLRRVPVSFPRLTPGIRLRSGDSRRLAVDMVVFPFAAANAYRKALRS